MTKHCLLALVVLFFATSTAQAVPEICGNGVDDDSDGFADESCYPGLTTGITDSPLSTGDTGMVSPSGGSLYYALPPDVAPKVPFGPSISLRRMYASFYNPGASPPAYKKPLGDRWLHNWMGWVVDNSTTLVIHMPSGQDVYAFKTGNDGCDVFEVRSGRAFQNLRRCSTGSASVKGYWLKTLEGAMLRFDITSKKLSELRDTLATPNKVLIAYDGNGQVSTVTDAAGHKRLLMGYASSLLSSVALQTINTGGTWTTRHTTSYGYTSGALTSVTIGGALAQSNSYTSSYLTQIQDGGGKTIVSFSYDSATAGKAVRVDTTRGMVGFEFAATRTGCSGSNKTVLYFNLGSATSCSVDGDCGSGFLCGGKTGSGATGRCFRAARCLTVDTTAGHHEDVVTGVTALGPPGESCDGACTDIATYLWDNATKYVASLGTQDPGANYSVRTVNANGLPTQITYGDPDSNATNGNAAREVYLFYDSTFPGRLSEIRRKSDLISPPTCSSGNSSGCARTRFLYNADGLVSQRIEEGTTLDSTGANEAYSLTTTYTYDKGRLKTINGPLTTVEDVTTFDYWTSTNSLLDGYVQNYNRQKNNAGVFITSSTLDYDFWGNPIALRGPDTDTTPHTTGTVTCLTFDSARGYLAQRREAMAGQADCATSNGADITTSWARDSALRLTQSTRPDGSCVFYEYDTKGRLQRTKRRDDCNAASAGDKQEYVYDSEGLITEIQTYDAAGNLTAKQPFTYFDSRKLEKVVNPVDTSKWTGLVYDSRGFVTEVNAANGLGKTVNHIDADGRTTSVDRYKDATLFDTWNLLYDWLGDQKQVTDGDSKVMQTVRDDLGRVVKRISPDMSYPTLLVYNGASWLVTKKEAFGGGLGVEQTHTFTYDNMGRLLTADYDGICPDGTPQPEIQRVYDAPPGGCDIPGGCKRTGGRLAYVKAQMFCSNIQPGTDGSWDQETWYSYDDDGRVANERIADDAGRIDFQAYTWTKNGALSQTTMPSTAVIGWTYGSAGNNSDTDLIAGQFRTNTSTPIVDTVKWMPYGPLKTYNWEAQADGAFLRTDFGWNLAYRPTVVDNGTFPTGVMFRFANGEDAKGRTTSRVYTPALAGAYDSYFLYDNQDRVTCETSTLQSSCPITGGASALKNNQVGGFTNAGDWKKILRQIPGSTGGLSNEFNPSGYGTSHQVTMVRQADGTPSFGDTEFGYDARGNRTYDDNTSTLTHDRRDYYYDARGNMVAVAGQYYTGGAWHDYIVGSAFDAWNRRIYKEFFDWTTGKQAQWFFYYDPLNRLTEVRYTPDSSVPATYSVFQLFWLRDRLVLYWQTDYPSVTTSKRYTATDETGRIYGLVNWPASPPAARYWAINQTAWGSDTPVDFGQPDFFQPMLFPGQYKDAETAALENDGATVHRPGVVLNGFRTYDPFTGGYLQVDPLVPETWSSYLYVNSNPVGKNDPLGLLQSTGEAEEAPIPGEGGGGGGAGVDWWPGCPACGVYVPPGYVPSPGGDGDGGPTGGGGENGGGGGAGPGGDGTGNSSGRPSIDWSLVALSSEDDGSCGKPLGKPCPSTPPTCTNPPAVCKNCADGCKKRGTENYSQCMYSWTPYEKLADVLHPGRPQQPPNTDCSRYIEFKWYESCVTGPRCYMACGGCVPPR